MPRPIQELLALKELPNQPCWWFIVGDEPVLVERALLQIKQAALKTRGAGLEVKHFRASEHAITAVVDELKSLSLFSPQRFVVIRELDSYGAEDVLHLLPYLDKRIEQTDVLLCASELDGRSKLFKTAEKAGILYEASTPKGAMLRNTLIDEAKRLGHTLSARAADAMLDTVGKELWALVDALERLSLFLGPGKPIDENAVRDYLAIEHQETIWMLIDAVSKPKADEALKATQALFSKKESPLGATALLARQLRSLGKAQAALREKQRPEEVARRAGVPPFKAREICEAAKRIHPRILERGFKAIDDAERLLKSSKQLPANVLDTLILKLCER